MNKINREQIMQRLREHYEVSKEKGYETIGIFLQGSQNYGLDTPESDIDTKCIILPKLDDIIKAKRPVSYTHIMENNEHVDFKDVREYVKCFKKQNINFVEILFTDYFILNPKYSNAWMKLVENREAIARYDIAAGLRCIAGMAMEKFKALKHPYPSIKEKIEKYGYDPKQLHHIVRLHEFIKRFLDGETYKDCLMSRHMDELIRIKNPNPDDILSVDEAEWIASTHCKSIDDYKHSYLETHQSVKDESVEKLLDEFLYEVIKSSITSEIAANSV